MLEKVASFLMWLMCQLCGPVVVAFLLFQQFVGVLAAGCTGALSDTVDVAVEVTSGVLLALDSLSSFFSAFFLALQFSVVCFPFLQ